MATYTRFVLLGYPRCGSTLLAHALGAHTQIRMFLELFHPDAAKRAKFFRTDQPTVRNYEELKEPTRRFYQPGEDAGDFLREAVYYERANNGTTAVGFKLFYGHGRKAPSERKLWDYLANESEILVVHLTRKNLFHQLVSRERVRRTNEWVKYKSNNSAPPQVCHPFTLEPAYCIEYFERIIAHREWIGNTLPNNPFIEIEYEDLSGPALNLTFTRILSFLGLKQEPPKILTEKTGVLLPESQVRNYSELKQFFANTRFDEFFNDSISILP